MGLFFLFKNVSCPSVQQSELFSEGTGDAQQVYFHNWSITEV